jgi:hypothetical protein
MHSRCLAFFPFKFGGGGEGEGRRIFFQFSLVLNVFSYDSFKFPMGSPEVPNLFLNMLSFHLYRWAKQEELYISNRTFYFRGASIVSFFMSDRPIKLARCKK